MDLLLRFIQVDAALLTESIGGGSSQLFPFHSNLDVGGAFLFRFGVEDLVRVWRRNGLTSDDARQVNLDLTNEVFLARLSGIASSSDSILRTGSIDKEYAEVLLLKIPDHVIG